MVRKRKEDFGNFVSGILQNSMLTGIPQIATAGNLYKKVIRAIVFVACLAGFVYQSMVFMEIYWEYKTVIDVQVINTKTTEMPSITVCNLSGLYSSKICNDSRFVDHCSKVFTPPTEYEIEQGFPTTDWCSCLPNRWCVDGVIDDKYLLPSWKLLRKLDKMPYDDYKMFFQEYRDFVTYCANEMIFPTEFHPLCKKCRIFSCSLDVDSLAILRPFSNVDQKNPLRQIFTDPENYFDVKLNQMA